MRITDDRYSGEMDKFALAVRMIRHEARTGTIRQLTGFSEDRIRKIYGTYFKAADAGVRRRRGKSPRQISRFVGTSARRAEATVLASLFLFCGALEPEASGRRRLNHPPDRVLLGERVCDAYEAYQRVHPDPTLSFEWAMALHQSLTRAGELYLASCTHCLAPYVQDRYALDYGNCPFCELREAAEPI